LLSQGKSTFHVGWTSGILIDEPSVAGLLWLANRVGWAEGSRHGSRYQSNGLIAFVVVAIIGLEVKGDGEGLLTGIPLSVHHRSDGGRLHRIWVLIVHS